MLTKRDKNHIDRIKRELLVIQGQLKDLAHENGEGDVFGSSLDMLNDTVSCINRESLKITFN